MAITSLTAGRLPVAHLAPDFAPDALPRCTPAHLLRSTWSEGQVPKSGPEIKVLIIPQIVEQK